MRTRITALIALGTLLCSSMVLAAPTKLSQQGRLLDGDGAPLTDGHGLTFTLHDAETDGNEVWREERVVQFDEGYYSIVLGTVTPLEDLLFAGGTVWMQLAVDGVELSPRQEVVSVPYALRAAVAESVEGGAVDADEVAIGGSVVIDSSGNWLGTPTDWSELTGVPADLSDGDADSDILLGLPCADGFVAKYSSSLGAWDCAQDNDSLAALICLTGEIPVYDLVTGLWLCGADLDTDTQLTEAQVDAFVANNNYSTGAHTTDTDTQLTETQVDDFVANNNYSVGAHTTDTDTQLTETQVDDFVANNGYSVGAHTTNTDVLGGLSCLDGEVAHYNSNSSLWMCAADAVLTETQVETYITNGALAMSGDFTVDTSTLFVDSTNNRVGIGTSTPAEPLHIVSAGNGGVEIENTSGAPSLTFDMPSNEEARILFKEDTETRASIVWDSQSPIVNAMIFKGRGTNTEVMRIDSAGNVGIGTTSPGEKLTVTGTVESTSGGFKFPDGSRQASASAGSPGTVLYTRCAWTGSNAESIGSCTPPSCPTAWSDLGITGKVKTAASPGNAGYANNNTYSESAGYRERGCYSATPVTILVTRCAWTGSNAESIGSCTPPSCPSNWSDLGITGKVKTAASPGNAGYANNNTYSESAGYRERTCSL
jgi:hypothetical protein